MHPKKAYHPFIQIAYKLNILKRCLPKNRRKNHVAGIRAKKPGEILHADVTIFRPADHTKVYIYIIQDNFSRAILSWNASLEISSSMALENLKNALTLLPSLSQPIKFITDDGSENAGKITAFLNDNGKSIQHVVAQKDIVQSNSMIESVNKRIKYDFLFRKDITDYKCALRYIEEAVKDFNNRPHAVLFGSTPIEIFTRNRIENNFKQLICEAKSKRLSFNQQSSCCIKLQSPS